MKKLNLKLLNKLVSYQSRSATNEMIEFVMYLYEYLRNKNVDVVIDDYFNLYVTKGNAELYPCVVAHTDINQSVKEKVELILTDGILTGFDGKKQVGCGFDDKVGVCIALQLLDDFDNIKLFLPADEEIGCVGTKHCDMTFFDDVSFVVQPDRNSKNRDFIYYTNGIECCSNEFIKAASDILKYYNYTPTMGVYTDVGELKHRGLNVCCFNLSCGYVNEHTDNEFLIVEEANVCYQLITELIEDFSHVKWEHEPESYYSSLFTNTEDELLELLDDLIVELAKYDFSNTKIERLTKQYYKKKYGIYELDY